MAMWAADRSYLTATVAETAKKTTAAVFATAITALISASQWPQYRQADERVLCRK